MALVRIRLRQDDSIRFVQEEKAREFVRAGFAQYTQVTSGRGLTITGDLVRRVASTPGAAVAAAEIDQGTLRRVSPPPNAVRAPGTDLVKAVNHRWLGSVDDDVLLHDRGGVSPPRPTLPPVGVPVDAAPSGQGNTVSTGAPTSSINGAGPGIDWNRNMLPDGRNNQGPDYRGAMKSRPPSDPIEMIRERDRARQRRDLATSPPRSRSAPIISQRGRDVLERLPEAFRSGNLVPIAANVACNLLGKKYAVPKALRRTVCAFLVNRIFK